MQGLGQTNREVSCDRRQGSLIQGLTHTGKWRREEEDGRWRDRRWLYRDQRRLERERAGERWREKKVLGSEIEVVKQ